MRILLVKLSFGILLSSCSSNKLVNQYSNPDISEFRPKKILIVGLTPDGGLQRQFEYSMVKGLDGKNVRAVKSVDLYGEPFTISEVSENPWKVFESQLLAEGYDAVLLSKITGQENRVTLAQSYRNLVSTFETFGDYYKENRSYAQTREIEDYPVLNTETSLYCLCSEGKIDLVWRGNIDVVNSSGSQKTIRDYVKTLIKTLRQNQIIN